MVNFPIFKHVILCRSYPEKKPLSYPVAASAAELEDRACAGLHPLSCYYSFLETEFFDYGYYPHTLRWSTLHSLQGDTVINAASYKNLMLKRVFYDPFQLDSSYLGALREVSRRVYLNFGGKDTLLYDFNLRPGDTLRSYITPESCGPYILQSVDSEVIGPSFRKKYIFNSKCLSQGLIFEGIGSIIGFTEPFVMGFNAGSSLSCFQVDMASVYPDVLANCDVPTAIYRPADADRKWSLSPNPLQETSSIHLFNDYYSIEIFSMEGILLKKEIIRGRVEYPLHAADWKSGCYMFRLTLRNGGTSSGFFIVT